MAIIVFQHSVLSAPGRLGATLRDHGLKLDIRRLDQRGPGGIPPDFDNVHGVISLGGPQNVGEDHPWMEGEIAYLRRAHELQLPVIGVCLGAQLIAHALGGQVGSMSALEWGFTRMSLNTFGQVETLLAGLAWESHQFQAHGQEIKELPAESTLLASSEACKVQIFRAGIRTFGFQHHFECDRTMIEAFARSTPDELQRAGLSPADLSAQMDRHYDLFARMADRLCVNIATYLFPLQRTIPA
jgi:GMP synthase (glutamine-hydrolysing)